MANTPTTKPPGAPVAPPPAHTIASPPPRAAPVPKDAKDNPLHELAEKQKQEEQKRRELIQKEETEADSQSLAERETLATGERRARQAAGIEEPHYLQSQADNERAQIEERVEEQAAAKRHPATGETVLVAGVPPRPDMAVDEPVDESHLSENTKAEMMAGREALKSAGKKSEAEQAAGRKALRDRADSHPHKPYTEE